MYSITINLSYSIPLSSSLDYALVLQSLTRWKHKNIRHRIHPRLILDITLYLQTRILHKVATFYVAWIFYNLPLVRQKLLPKSNKKTPWEPDVECAMLAIYLNLENICENMMASLAFLVSNSSTQYRNEDTNSMKMMC